MNSKPVPDSSIKEQALTFQFKFVMFLLGLMLVFLLWPLEWLP